MRTTLFYDSLSLKVVFESYPSSPLMLFFTIASWQLLFYYCISLCWYDCFLHLVFLFEFSTSLMHCSCQDVRVLLAKELCEGVLASSGIVQFGQRVQCAIMISISVAAHRESRCRAQCSTFNCVALQHRHSLHTVGCPAGW